jgi:hypothetical protein
MAGHVYALLVGIDAYTGGVPQLSGCVNDVTAFAAVLQGRVSAEDLSLVTITDEDATRAAVTTEFSRLLGQAGAEDVALFYYSGHGAHQDAPEELWPYEPDHQNETLVLFDSRETGGWDLADKELAVLIAQVAASGCHLLVVLDCCHSGDATRDVDEVVRQAPSDDRHRPIESFLTGTLAQAAAQAAAAADGQTTRDLDQAPRERWTPPAGRHVLLAACRSSEKAKEIRTQGQHRGALSAALEKTLVQSEDTPSYRDVLLMVTSQVTTTVRDQHPQFETVDSSELDRPFLGGSIPDTPRPLTLSHRPEGWVIDSGAVHGVPEPIRIGDTNDTTELAIYALSAVGRGQPLATAVVTRVLPDRSVVTVTPELDPSSIYRAVMTSIPLKPLAVAVAGDAAGTSALRSAADKADSTLIDLIEASDTPPPPDLQVEATPAGFVITRPGLVRPLVPVVAGEGREGRTIAALEHVARWLRLSGLTNPTSRLATNAVHVSVVTADGRTDDGGTVEIAYVDDKAPKFTVTLENTTKEPLWAALLDLTDSYGIYTDAFAAGRVALAPGEKTSLELGGEVPDVLWNEGIVTVTDRLIVVTSTMEFDPRSLQQGDLAVSTLPGSDGGDGAGGTTTRSAFTPRSTLERMLGSVTTRRLPPRTTETIADWRTNRIDVVTSRPHP